MKRNTFIKVFLIIIVVIAITTIFYASYAFFTSDDSKDNTFSVGETKILLEEPNWNPEDGENLIPGKTIIKDPTIISSKGKSYSRVILEFKDKDGTLIEDEDRLNLIKSVIFYDNSYDNDSTPVTKNLINGSTYNQNYIDDLVNNEKIFPLYNFAKYTLDEDRSSDNIMVFKCSVLLNPGDEDVLFTNIVIPSDFTNEDMELLGEFDLILSAEAIQDTGFATIDEAFAQLDRE